VLDGDLRTDAAGAAPHAKAKLRLSFARQCAMTAQSYARLAALLFAFIAVLQFIRAVGGWEIVVNGTMSVPVSASWIACIIAAGLAWIGFDASRR
jgi:hypothetical protein